MTDSPSPCERLAVQVDRPTSASPMVRGRGELDLATAPLLQERLEPLLSERVENLVLDLRDVPFCDVTGLNVLLRAQSGLSMHGGRLTVLHPCPSLRVIIAVLGLGQRLHPVGGRSDHAGEDGARGA